ncbi:MAG: 2-oxoglutarate dehydrogenase complex dihydrolipoyllysine-residue succinyltransferase [Gammaproteobacteria bacterium]|nr:2-oxoglutarate dehydrogenase complex dihydrolipoyllysine-residue succinyltransferase [Gammaproteobacteria bacterium]
MMSIEIKVPVLPESVADASIAVWHKKPGEPVEQDENLVDIETDKVVLEVVAPDNGVLEEIIHNEGDIVTAEQVIARFNVGDAVVESTKQKEAPVKAPDEQIQTETVSDNDNLSPAVRRLIAEHNLQASSIPKSGKGGRLTRDDVMAYLDSTSQLDTQQLAEKDSQVQAPGGERIEKRVPMTRLRVRIAERLVQSQQTAAILTTFNEVNMKPVIDIRKKYKDSFEKEKGVRLGFMSFFIKAAVEALKRYPIVNASIDGNDVVYHSYFDIGVAVSSPRGLVVPVVRDADMLSMAEIESTIRDLGVRAQENKLTVDELTGGTFTVSNGGVFGSLMSTPIINPPQSGILGMHATKERPMAVDGEVVILPMMYLAFSYDHRLVDGRESVGFLKTIKELLEDPARILLEI